MAPNGTVSAVTDFKQRHRFALRNAIVGLFWFPSTSTLRLLRNRLAVALGGLTNELPVEPNL